MFKAKKINKLIAVFLTVFLLLFNTLSPVLTYAQVASPTPDPSAVTPTPDPTTTTPTPTPADTTIISPTPTPIDTPTPTPDPTLGQTNASNSADLTNTTNSNAVTGDNSINATGSAGLDSSSGNQTGSSASSSGSGSSNPSTQTGNATSVVNQQNSVNSTSINSNVIYQTLNIYIAQNGDLNLSDPFTIAADAIQTHPNDPVINVYVTNVNNYTYLTNNISSNASTGNNTTNSLNGNATINTGNAYSVVSLLNQVNFTAVNSQVHILSINIFGNLNGNIILPDPSTSTNCSGCGISLTASNSATVTNNLNSTADTGNNVASGSATIQTGNANSAVNAVNITNANLVGVNSQILYINLLGTWTGNFIGWGSLSPEQGGASMIFSNLNGNGSSINANGCESCTGNLNINNNAFITNNINSSANTGGNNINGSGGSITTGNAFSVISLINLINTNFINSFGFFGFINIFGNWNGNIGGLSNFLALNNSGNNNQDSNNATTDNNSSNTTASTAQEQGGQLSVTQTNNVGAFVYPGDTVTFFIKVRNTGSGKVYGTKLKLFLIYNNQIAGGTTFNLGDISAGNGKGLTTGFVLSKNAPRGYYVARAQAEGTIGPNNTSISALADSNFNVLNNFTAYIGTQKPNIAVLGANNKTNNSLNIKNTQSSPYLLALILVLLAYLILRGIKKRRSLANLLSSADFKTKLSSLRMFLF